MSTYTFLAFINSHKTKQMLKLLWFSGNPSLYAQNDRHNGGGWISSLQREIQKKEDIELCIAFPWATEIKETIDGVKYYGIVTPKYSFYKYKSSEKRCLKDVANVINEFNPDAIVVFGTETVFGLVPTITDKPVFIHIQGMLSSYYENWLPQGLSWFRYVLNPRNLVKTYGLKIYKKREMTMYRSCHYFFGRTWWDRCLVDLLSNKADYFYCSEMLRPSIYNSSKIWRNPLNKTKKLISIISSPVYKGADVVLRTAKILHEQNIDFEWTIYGGGDICFFEKLTGIKAIDVNVRNGGIINSTQLVDVITASDIYIHPSYIENSPNTVCEAQLLGIPVIATNVGGTSSLIENLESGILVPANDVYSIASYIKKILKDDKFAKEISRNGRRIALERHKPETIAHDFLNAINNVLNRI